MPDEFDPAERPFVLIWEVTQACELACKHCRASAEPNRHPDELTTAEGLALLEDVSRFGPGQLVVLSGGDPLFRNDIERFVEHGTDLGLRMTMTPSGTSSLSPSRVAALQAAGLRRMALSIDGATAATHDAFRGEPGSFAETVQAAEAARSRGLALQINTTVCRETVDQLPEIRHLVADLEAVLWSVFFLVPIGRGAVLEQLAPDRAERVMRWLVAVDEEEAFGVKTTEAPHYRRVALQEGHGGPGPTPSDGIGRRTGITAGNGFAFVSHTGEIYPSGFLPIAGGSVPEESVVEVYRTAPLFEALRDRDALGGKCGACEFKHVCGGSRSRAYATTGDPLGSDPLCGYRPDGYEGPMPDGAAALDP